MTIAPAPLEPGDHLRVIAPSTTLGIVSSTNRNIATERLEAMGFRVSFGHFVDDVDHLSSATTEKRLSDLHAAFADPSVDGILTAIGGYNSNDLLPGIDWDLIAANPKFFCGYSDITVLTSAINARVGLVTFSGPHYSTFAMLEHFDQTVAWFRTIALERRPAVLDPASTWSDDAWYLDQADRAITTNEGHWILGRGAGSGTVVGGNLCTLNLLHGTGWMPELADSVLFIEDDASSDTHTFARDLVSLTHQPGFGRIAALLIGRFQRSSEMDRSTLRQLVSRLGLPAGVPVIANVEFGHTDPMATIPIGGSASVEALPGNATIEVRW